MMTATARSILGFLVLLAAVSPAGAQEKGPSTSIRADVRFASLYNSNILQYSNGDMDVFLSRLSASRFAIKSLDDVVFRGTASVSVSRLLVGSRPSRLHYSYVRNALDENPIADSYSHFASYQQPLSGTGWISVAYSRVAHTYLRHLWDVDFTAPYLSYPHYQPAVISIRRVRIEGGFRTGEAWAFSARVGRARLGYSAAFRERDSRSWELAAQATDGQAGAITLTLEPRFTSRVADGRDPAHPELPDSLRDDTSFREWGLGADLEFPKGRFLWIPAEVGIELRYENRAFTTDRRADVNHHGRHDRNGLFGVTVEKQIEKGVGLFGTFRFESQSTSGATAVGERSEAGTFRQTVAGGGIHLSWSDRFF